MIYSANIKTIDYSDGNTNIIVKAYGKPMKSDLAMYENEVNYKKVVSIFHIIKINMEFRILN